MKVYRLKLILGKTPNYDENGKLKNKVIKAKYSGERELHDILDDDNYRKLGACEISCIGVYDTKTKKEDVEGRMDEVNAGLKDKEVKKPKSKVELLEEQNELLRKQLESKPKDEPKSDDKELKEAQSKYLELYGRKPNHLMKLEGLLRKIEEKS